MKHRLRAAVAAALALVGGAAVAAPPLVLANANLIDGVGDKPQRGVSILVVDGKIVSVGSSVAAPESARRIDLKGRWVLPGFVDAHVHPSSLGDARNMLKAGVTTGRSMLTMHFVDAGIQALHKGGAPDVPEILPAGYPIVPDPGSFIPDIGGIILDTPALADLWGKPLDDDGIRRLVRANIARGATVIKVFATDRAGVLTSDPRRPMLTEAQLRVAVTEARAGGAKVAAHAHGDEGAAAAVRAGVDTVDHGAFLEEGTLRLMREKGVCYVPTMAIIADSEGAAPGQVVRARMLAPRSLAAVKTALAVGTKVAAGTDSDYGSNNELRLADELDQLRAAGMSPMDVLRAATSVSADCVGIGQRTGRVQAGFEADLLIIDGNPLDDLGAVRDVAIVVNDGVVAYERPW